MAQLLKDGSIRMNDGRILWGRDQFCIIDFAELSQLLTPAPRTSGGFAGFGGGKGAKGDRGLQGIQGPPGLISLIQDEGFNLPLQNTLNFIGENVSVVDDPGNGRLNITVDDLYAATRIVSLDPAQGTDLTIQDAINNLPSEGGTIFVKHGTYPISATIILPDKPVVIRGAGESTIIDLGANAISAFTVPNGLTDIRRFFFYDLVIRGNGVAAQSAYTLSDANALGQIFMDQASIEEVIKPFNITAYDVSYANDIWIYCYGGHVFQPSMAGTYTLVSTPSPAGTFAAPGAIIFEGTLVDNLTVGALSWTFDADIDLIFRGSGVNLVLSGANACNGLLTAGLWGIQAAAASTLETFGSSNSQSTDTIADIVLFQMTLKLSWKFQRVDGVKLHDGGAIQVNAPNIIISNTQNQTLGVGLPAVRIDVLAGADDVTIIGGQLPDATTAIVRVAAQRTKITGCGFSATGAHNTVADVGAGDFTLGVGNQGVSSGAGLSLAANSRITIGDYNFG